MCGIFGIQGTEDAAVLTHWALHALQSRGQESYGIAVRNSGEIVVRRALGLAGQALNPGARPLPHGRSAVGHVRYSTSGQKHDNELDALANTHPFTGHFKYGAGKYGDLALVHNGNFTNADTLRDALYGEGRTFRSDADTEVLVHLIGKAPRERFVERLKHALSIIEGAYSLLMLTGSKLVAVRDSYGTHPLVMGKRGDAYVFASETCALDIIGATYVRDVEPGEIVVVERGEAAESVRFATATPRPCIFETVYTMFPGSLFSPGTTVYEVRERIGAQLAREGQCDPRAIVVPVPESGAAYALGFARESGLRFEQGILRNHYAVGRAFIEPTDARRDMKVRKKFSANRAVRGEVCYVIDDSAVRGTTSRLVVDLMKEAGAHEVHLRFAYPPFIGGCPSGTDVPSRRELIAYGCTSVSEVEEKVCRETGATSVRFITHAGLYEAVGVSPTRVCNGCITREWPFALTDAKYREL